MADTKNAINKLSLVKDGKAIKYFVEFNKYKSRTRFNDQSYYVMVQNQMLISSVALPNAFLCTLTTKPSEHSFS